MSIIKFSNYAATTFSGAHNDAVTTFNVAAGTGNEFPVINQGGAGSDYCYIMCENTAGSREIVKCTRRDLGSDALTVARAQEGTGAISYDNGNALWQPLTAGVLGTMVAGTLVDGDILDITWNPSNYTPATTPAEASDVDDLTAHLYGIDQAIGTLTTNIAAWGDIPSGEKILFYKDTAVSGYSLVVVDDKLAFVTKSSGEGGETGGGAHATGTWTQPNHTHTYSDIINHTHPYWAPWGGGVIYGGSINYLTRNTSATTSNPSGGVAQGTTDGGATANTWRPGAACCTLQQRS